MQRRFVALKKPKNYARKIMSENADNNKTSENDHIFNVTDNVDYKYMIEYIFVTIRGGKH